jgi:hypothetical protein
MSRDDREGPDPRRSGGSSTPLIVLLVGGCFALLLVLAVVGAGFLFMARSAEHAEMQVAMVEHEAIAAEARADAAKQIYSREDFKALVDGKTEREVETAVGTPPRMQQEGKLVYWDYDKRTLDTATGKLDPMVRVTFELGRVTGVTYTNADR